MRGDRNGRRVVCHLQQVACSAVRPFPSIVPTTAHPRLVRREPALSTERRAPTFLPPEGEAQAGQAPEFLPREAFDDLATGIWNRPPPVLDDIDTAREYSQPLPALPKPKPAPAVQARKPRPSALLEDRPRPMLRSPRSSADSIAQVRPIALPALSPQRAARSSRPPDARPAEPVARRRNARGSMQQPAARGSMQQQAARGSMQQPAVRPSAPMPAPSFRPPRGTPLETPYGPAIQEAWPEIEPPRGAAYQPPRAVVYDPPRPVLSHQDEPLAFGGEVLRRPATAVEPAIGRSIREPRTIVFTLSAAAAVVAAALVVVAGWKIIEARQLRPAETVLDRAVAEKTIDGPRMMRVALSPDEESRVIHKKTAMFRDRWRQDVWFHPLTGEMRLPENPTRRFGAKRHGKRPIECGRGHCGVDVGEFGLTVHAVRDGVVERCQRTPKDNAGRYLRIAHDDGFVSYYIHLNSIRDDLEVGSRVKGGEEIGITGKSGVKRSRPHLHFALAYRDENGEKYFIDPEPLLKRSVLTSSIDDVAAAKAADALIVASRPPALDDGVEAGGEHKVHKGRHKHSTEDDRPE